MERSETVVIVDDDREIRVLIELALAKPGRAVVGFGDGQEALDYLARADAVDLVISDVAMEGFDGHRLLRHLRANARTAATPVIFVTAEDAADERVGGIGERAVEQLRKPFDIAELRRRADGAIERRESDVPPRDATTGWHTQPEFVSLLGAALSAAQPEGPPLALMAGDLDGTAGESALARVSDIIDAHLRATDCAGRLGARAFATLHPACDAAGATAIAQRILAAVSADPQCAGAAISLGLAIARSPKQAQAGALLVAARDALAAAKISGEPRMALRTV